MNEEQIKDVLRNLQKLSKGYKYETGNREIYLHLDDIEPYVVGYKRYRRSFSCDGLSEMGKALIGD